MAESNARECDAESALERLGGDVELYREVLRRFFADADTSLERIRTAIAASQADELHRAAHSFKGLAAMAGTEAVARTAGELEQLGRQGQLTSAAQLLDRMVQELARSRRELAPHFP